MLNLYAIFVVCQEAEIRSSLYHNFLLVGRLDFVREQFVELRNLLNTAIAGPLNQVILVLGLSDQLCPP